MAQSMRRLVHAAILAVVVMLFTAPVQHAFAALTAAQSAATLAFLQDFPVALPSLASSWTGTDYCSFSGVSCDATTGYVSVDLSGRGLNGYMPGVDSDIDGSQVMVVSINLSNNRGISGNYKDDWAALKNLKSLDLSETNIYGNLPDAWNGMTSLQTVRVVNGLACRNLPNWNITTLTSVDLSNNNMGGVLASSWASMTSLSYVNIAGNSFCGCVPKSWTASVLSNAAAAVGGNLVSSSCATSNTCGSKSYECPTTNAAVAPLQLTMAVATVLMAVSAVMGL